MPFALENAANLAHVLPAVREHASAMVDLRHHIHAHPELAYEEHATSDLVATRLAGWGYEVHRGLAGTGVVGTLRLGSGTRRLGLRADMDALPIQEATGLPYASRHAGRMHACGHDGHTAILLAAARVIAQERGAWWKRACSSAFPATPSSPCTTCRVSRSASWASGKGRSWPRPTR
jgi:hippurate hydrolase